MTTAPAAAAALSTPAPVTATTAPSPYQAESYARAREASGRATAYEAGLSNLTNQEIQRELGRYRDEVSGGLLREGEAAILRGADPALFRTRLLGESMRAYGALQGRLADVALGRRGEALGLMRQSAAGAGEIASGIAENQRGLQLGTLAARLAEERLNMERTALQSRVQEDPYRRLMEMLQLVSGNPGAFALFGRGGSAPGGAPGGASGIAGMSPRRWAE